MSCPVKTPVGSCQLPEGHEGAHHVVSMQIRMGPIKTPKLPPRKMLRK